MLTAAREALVQHGVLRPDEDLPPFHGRFAANLVLGMLVHLNDGSFYLVKVAAAGSLEREYFGLSMAHAAMPRNTPRPLGLSTHDSFPVLVVSGIRHSAVAPLNGGVDVQRFEAGLNKLLEISPVHFRVPPDEQGACDLREALERASRHVCWPDWQDYRARVAPEIAALPRVYQHGDLSLNNIGVADGELIFFDWEDFGLVDVPGLDLAIVLLSLHDFDAVALMRQLSTQSLEQRLMQSGSARLGMAVQTFLLLFPAYLSLFASMKAMRGYDAEVSARAYSALQQWLAGECSPSRLSRPTVAVLSE
jgi:aminoglycoside phosphotransferase (APT) family kinase protein